MFCFVFLFQKNGSNNSQKNVENFGTAMAANRPAYPGAWQRTQVAGLFGQVQEIWCRPCNFCGGNLFGSMDAAMLVVPLGLVFFAKVLARCFFPSLPHSRCFCQLLFALGVEQMRQLSKEK